MPQIGFLNVCLSLQKAVSPRFNHHAVATALNTRVQHHTKHGAAPLKILLKTYSNEDALVEASNVQEFHQITELHAFDSNTIMHLLIPLLALLICRFDVRKSVHHHTIQINQPTRCNSFTSLFLDVYVWLNMFRAPLRPSSGVYNCTRSLWFYRWKEAAGELLVVVSPRLTTLQPPR